MNNLVTRWLRLPNRNWLLAAGAVLLCFSSHAQIVDTKGECKTNDVAPRSFKFQTEPGTLVIRLSVQTKPGAVSFEIRSTDGALLDRQSAGIATINRWSVTITNRGDYELVVTPHGTAGFWQARIDRVPPLGALYAQVISGALMMLAALIAVFAWWFYSRVQWRWFWAGAGIWTVGVALKFAVALPLNPFFFGRAGHGAGLKLVIGSVYCGLLTGIFEIGITLAAALIWRRLARGPARAVAVGLGAGAFEAFLLGLAAFGGSLAAAASGQADQALTSLATMATHTPLLWLVGPVERVIAILAHTASRVLVLRAVASRRWLGFWAGFAWLSAVDLLAGVVLLTGMTTSGSLWLIELMLLPFGLLSIPLTVWAVRHWPLPPADVSASAPPPLQPTVLAEPEAAQWRLK
jgi:uncharacterized membrane protein YhfC